MSVQEARRDGIGDAGGDLQRLLDRMRSGDSEAVSEFVDRYGERVRRRVRWRLTSALRRVYDSTDVLSTVSRRLVSCVRRGNLQAATPEQLLAFVAVVAEHAVIDQRRAGPGEAPASLDLAEVLIEDSGAARLDDAELFAMLEAAASETLDETDRRILDLWLRGRRQDRIAAALGVRHEVVRKRLERLRGKLRAQIDGDSAT